MSYPAITTRKFAELIGVTHEQVVSAAIEFGQYTCAPLLEMQNGDGFNLDRDFSLILAGHFGLEPAFVIGGEWSHWDCQVERVIERAKG